MFGSIHHGIDLDTIQEEPSWPFCEPKPVSPVSAILANQSSDLTGPNAVGTVTPMTMAVAKLAMRRLRTQS